MNEEKPDCLKPVLNETDYEKRLKMIKNLDVKTYLEELNEIADETSFIPHESQCLMILHKARYFLARQGYLDKKYMRDSRSWLLSKGFKIPNI